MSRKAAKVSVVKKSIKDPELIQLFNQMIGVSEPDPSIVIPKYEKIMTNAKDIIQILERMISGGSQMKPFADMFGKGMDDIRGFIIAATKELAEMELEPNDRTLTGEQMQEINSDPQKLVKYLENMNLSYKINGLKDKYTNLKNSNTIREIIMLARNIKTALMLEKERAQTQKHDLENKVRLSDNFIMNSESDYLPLFNFSSIDFKQMFISDLMTAQLRERIILVLHLIYIRAIVVVDLVTTPDIDADKFSHLIVDQIRMARKHIPRCGQAFDKIEKSVDLLRENMGEYYKDFVTAQSNNPGVFFENFILDVAKTSKDNTEVRRQFRDIVNFYKKQMSTKQVNNPQLSRMVNLVGENLDVLDNKLTRGSGGV